MLSKRKFAFVIIDVENKYIEDLRGHRKVAFPRHVRQVANELREKFNIPTIVVTMDSGAPELHIYADKKTDPSCENVEARSKLIQTGTLSDLGTLDTDILAIKKLHDFFEDPKVASFLEDNGINGVIIGGMQGTVCVPMSIIGAYKHGLEIFVFPDCVADTTRNGHEKDNGHKPDYHKSVMRSCISRYNPDVKLDDITFIHSRDFIGNARNFLNTLVVTTTRPRRIAPHPAVKTGEAHA